MADIIIAVVFLALLVGLAAGGCAIIDKYKKRKTNVLLEETAGGGCPKCGAMQTIKLSREAQKEMNFDLPFAAPQKCNSCNYVWVPTWYLIFACFLGLLCAALGVAVLFHIDRLRPGQVGGVIMCGFFAFAFFELSRRLIVRSIKQWSAQKLKCCINPQK